MKKFTASTLIFILILCSIGVYARETFSDVPESDWAAPYIYNMVDRGIISGYGDGTFGRNNNVLRCEYAKMIVKVSNTPIVQNSVSAYADVPRGEWYFDYVNSVASYMTGIKGSDDVLYFDPNAPATREAVTVAAVKACGIDTSMISDPNAYLAERFSDWEYISTHNRAYVAAAVESGIITGDAAGTFRPRDPIIRAEVVIVLYRAFPDGSNVQPNVSYNESDAVNSELTAFFLDVGQGDSCFIELPNGETMLIDAGTASSAEYIVDFIKDRGHNTINYLVATHPHADHIGGMCDIFESFDVLHFYTVNATADSKTYKNTMLAAENEGCPTEYVSSGSVIMGIPEVSAKFIAPCREFYKNLNDNSAVLRLDYKESSYILSGDAENDAEGDILASGEYLDADVLKVGHHGSNTSSSFAYITAISPTVAVISCGVGNSYGHPKQVTVDNLFAIGAAVYRTDTDGTVKVSSHGEDITQNSVTVYGK